MHIYAIVFFVFSLIIGIVLVIVSLFLKNKEIASNQEEHQALEAINARIAGSVDEADASLEQLSKMSALVFEELEGKYKELLFLYQLIDEKKMEVERLYSKKIEFIEAKAEPLKVETSMEEANVVSSSISERFENVIELYKSGKSIAEISSDLNMGQGEIKLILGLGKVR